MPRVGALAIFSRKKSLANADLAARAVTPQRVIACPMDLGALLYKRRTALVKIGDGFYSSYDNKNGP